MQSTGNDLCHCIIYKQIVDARGNCFCYCVCKQLWIKRDNRYRMETVFLGRGHIQKSKHKSFIFLCASKSPLKSFGK